ncbi:hypothetical protein ABEV38_15715 [Parageobacillus thermoglucosidasius]|jgi:hypothetical protein|uniref:hypothetical protein n=1 Tax=Anoxybacillaceae TaxID=3120669 RepID=UPI0005CCE382|nr:hypothetical protein [Geobacillus kaustophilus]
MLQNANNIPFNFYDHVAVLFPGAIMVGYFIFIANKIFPNTLDLISKLHNFSSTLLILVLLIMSFIFGHIAYSISKWTFDKAFFSKGKPVDKFLDYSDTKQLEIISEVEKIYGAEIGKELRSKLDKYKKNEITGSEFGLKNYCYALVERKETKHDMFIALADFLRSTAFLLALGVLYLITTSILDWIRNCISGGYLIKIIIFSLFPILSSWLLLSRSIRMRKAADSVIYSQFLFDAKRLNSNNQK